MEMDLRLRNRLARKRRALRNVITRLYAKATRVRVRELRVRVRVSA